MKPSRLLFFLIIFLNLILFQELVHGKSLMQIKGSDTEINLVQRLAEEFMKKDPDSRIAITGGGSGTGIAALINNRVDIANSSREMSDEEVNRALKRGVKPVSFVFALDALAVITYTGNPVNHLTLAQLGQIFRGEITDWKDLGGPDGIISMYGRQSNSGTFIYFREVVLKGDYSPQVKSMNGNAQIVEAVKRDKAAIGYVGIGYVIDQNRGPVNGIKIINLANEMGTTPVSPVQPENILNHLYPLVRPLFQYTNGQPKGSVIDFLEFELSPQGQKIVGEGGFYPIGPRHKAQNKKALGK